ncbi:unnamed protein product [Closterium sp. Yama58-4]|nr:unnamed protein product [Closterium sp. Yama58-4]
MLPYPQPSCSPFLCRHARLFSALMLAFPLPSCSTLLCPHARLSSALMLASALPSCSPFLCPLARFFSALMLASPLPSCSPLLCPHARLCSAVVPAFPLPSCSPFHCPHDRLSSALMLCPRIYTPSLSHLWSDFFLCAEKWEGLDVCEQFSLQQMLSATNNWSEDNVLGKGGFGIVYKGRSPQGQLWAIKRSTIMFILESTAFPCCDASCSLRCCLSCCFPLPLSFIDLSCIIAQQAIPYLFLPPHCICSHASLPRMDTLQAVKLVETYDVEELKDSKMPAVNEEAIVDFADLALDCIKSPGTRRPTMKDVAYRLSALIEKHCPNEEDEWENVVKEEGTSNQEMPSESSGDGGREPERSHGSQSGVISFTGTFSMSDSLKSWLQLKPSNGH